MIKMVSWNVNGLRACMNKGFMVFFKHVDADIFCIQESKLQEGQLDLITDGYYQYWNYAVKKGYSGTAIFTKKKPISQENGIGIDEHDTEGRTITLEFDNYYLVNVYTPNAKRALERLSYRMVWEDAFRSYLKKLDSLKPVIVCGDMNVAHKEIDLKNPASNHKSAGFTDEERNKFSQLLDSGFIDTFRYLYPNEKDAYTWWSYMFNARAKNVGWRIDYFCISERIKEMLLGAVIHKDIEGSDHCPVEITLNL
ncbi:exodeoxyribonuclease III [Pseudobacteroides cellulosolvens]|uniref:Exodeoxyribonuclease III Xth n=1 Tax=Pseudobacteroides cellulosolvens ATCC 35603 = DSM 2933 TaxID=398512 RepID=A0A0L6JTW5_9FIRM|nr:exodeoxyribonuclease III [Pseudobacteroides cellulosolvens]KNY29281.1 exodeoxyribonuclease III Xth [Pseudobacteroides cellulosolvens ATCC 35603 = DSM 2933]